MTPDGKRTETLHDPRQAVLRHYAAAFDRFAEEEQVAIALGDYEGAQHFHEWGLVVLRSYHAEADDPKPRRHRP